MRNNNVLENVNSLMIAIILTSGMIARMIAAVGIFSEGMVPVLFIIALIVSYTIVIMTKTKVSFEKNSVIFIYIIILAFLLSFLFRGIDSYTYVYFIEFIFYGIITYLLSRVKYSPSLVIYFTMLIGNIILINPLAFKDYISRGYFYDFVSMDATYAILPSIVATIIYFMFIKKKGNLLINFITLLSNGYLLYILLFEGTRGAIVAILLLLIIIAYILLSRKMKINMGTGSFYSFFMAILFVGITIAAINIQKVLLWIESLLRSYDIEIAAITKTINMVERDGLLGILNARDRVYERGYELFSESPIWGHGIGSYADIYYGTYPHNLFLHLLVEGGLILTIPFTLIIIITLWILLKSWVKEDILNEKRIFILFLSIVCIPRLMLSSYLWKEQALWLLIFFLFTFLSKHKEHPENIDFVKQKT
ncbi:O-antigen ligase family protein [Oceanobacillus indicireducens]|uniref:O-antigen ligase-related domain-containing protein n=1 Tax=Oceanobacillus indicireducens TaxID=1004261 RepID=A0A917Y5K4_9BACI|nr:O-antigen ligase family protein [Oceanobacillus indicireducens]GGN66881.1 hypothetical protein GCM10007971_37250 [Oceanobacillus indicireducens]